MSDADFIREVEELYQRIAEADTDNFAELAKIAGLDLKTDLVKLNSEKINFENADRNVTKEALSHLIWLRLKATKQSLTKWITVKLIRGGLKADFTNADLTGANLGGANLKEANLRWADLRKANLKEANLTGADLTGAYLEGADLTGAYLEGADLTGAYLGEADLRKANLRWANLKDSLIDKKTVIDDKWRLVWEIVNIERNNRRLTSVYLRYANLSSSCLVRANLIGADLAEAILTRANLTEADLSGSNLEQANLIEANLTGVSFNNAIVKDARFGSNTGMTRALKQDLIARGAVFEDAPGDRSGVLVPV